MPSPTPHAAPPTHTILVVSGNVTLRERLYDLLARQRLIAVTVHAGAHALAMLEREHPSLIISDTHLTDMTGWDLAERARASRSLPVILIGAHDASSTFSKPSVQATLSPDAPDQAILDEITHWLTTPSPAGRQQRWHGSVLVVDDEQKLRALLKNYLELKGLEVATAGSGEEALKQLATLAPNVVLLDIKMPGMDGLVTLKKIKTLNANMVVVIMTALEEQQLMAQCFQLGAYEYVMKPIEFGRLDAVLLNKLFFN